MLYLIIISVLLPSIIWGFVHRALNVIKYTKAELNRLGSALLNVLVL
jgi:hypothetical protein